MRFCFGPASFLPVLLLLLAFTLACDDTSSPTSVTSTAVPTPAPSVQTATPLTNVERTAMEEFAQQLMAVEEEWDRFHEDFDDWRAALTTCHVSSAQQALHIFAADSNSVTEQARDIPRTSVTSELANILIEAAEEEEALYRQLRDRWQPTNLSLFEMVERQHSVSSRAQLKVEDMALELRERYEEGYTTEEAESAEKLGEALDSLRDSWSRLHDDYMALRSEDGNLDSTTLTERYGQLVQQSVQVVATAADLPSSEITKELVDTLREAADEELKALLEFVKTLTALVDSLSESEDSEGQATAGSGTDSDEDSNGQVDQSSPSFTLGSGVDLSSLQDEVDAAVNESQDALKMVTRTIKEILEGDSAENLVEIQSFQGYFEKLVTEWDAFRQRYNAWRSTEGGCDRVDVAEALSQFNLRIGELGRNVRDLPQGGLLLPMYTLIVQALDGEEVAMRTLYNSWRPFKVDAFKAADRERMNSDRLRRQASIALQELRDRP